jgi:iron complex outermembrane recepter protein
METRLQGRISTGPAEHLAIAGLDVYWRDLDIRFGFPSIASIDVFDPVYGARPVGGGLDFGMRSDDLAIGGYVQDQIKLWERLTLLGGVRFDHAEQEMVTEFGGPPVTRDSEDFAISPRAGILYQVTPHIAPYFSYAESFLPINFGTEADGSPLEPETGEQFEVGIKADALQGKLTATLAAYHLTRENVSVGDPANPGFSIQTGEQRSQGIEFDVAYRLLDGWNLIGAYAYTDSEITEESDPALEGNRPNNVPEHSGSIWTTYELQDGPLKGLGAGLGGRFVGEREGDLANSFTIPDYAVMDAALFYRRNRFRAQLNVRNVLDEEYFASSFSDTRVIPGEPVVVRGSVGWSF